MMHEIRKLKLITIVRDIHHRLVIIDFAWVLTQAKSIITRRR